MAQSLHQKQVEAYYTLLVTRPGRMYRVPIPFRGNPIPSDEDYKNTQAIWKETKELLGLMGIKYTEHDRFGLRVEE